MTRLGAFRAGGIFALFIYAGIYMFIQDYLGLEEYIEFLRNHWINLHWGWGLASATVGVIGATLCTIVLWIPKHRR